MPQVRPQTPEGDDETAVMDTRPDNSIAAEPRDEESSCYDATGEALRRGARAADMVKAGIAATTREFTEIVFAERPQARRDKDLSTEAIR